METNIRLPGAWEGWEIREPIGSGSFGEVYQAYYNGDDPAVTSRTAAVKIIRIPSGSAEAAVLENEMPDKADRIRYCENIVEGLLSEIRAMEALQENEHVVRLQDAFVEYKEEVPEWTVFIRMERLTPLPDYLITHAPEEDWVLRLGIEMCTALEACAEKGILHRDIKPENIMVTDDGIFRLGDFGVAKQMELTTGSLSLKGTFTYMAPEVYHGEKYDAKADQYSLGIVLYRLLNRSRDPFVDPESRMVYYKDREEALRRRMSGEALPPPAGASEKAGAVIRKACAYRKTDRYDSISDLKRDLMVCSGWIREQELICMRNEKDEKTRKNRVKRLLIPILAAAAALAAGIFLFLRIGNGSSSGMELASPAALQGTCGENLTWKIADGTLTIRGTGAMKDFSILHDPPPWENGDFTSIVVEEGVTQISRYAFHACWNVIRIQLPESLISIGDYAFDFWDLESIAIPENVNHIGKKVFTVCSSLSSITVDEDNRYYDSRDGCNAIIETASGTLIAACMNTVIPDGVAAIGPEAFSTCYDLTRIVIPDSVKYIDDTAFSNSEDLVICGSAGSAAEQYAEDHGLEFREI